MRRAFSLVELLVVFGIVAIVTMIGLTAYKNIREQAEKIAQDKDQAVLKQMVETFHITGGNVKKIEDIREPHRRAAVMTFLFQGKMPDATTEQILKHNRTVKGTINEMLPDDMLVVPYFAADHPNDGRLRAQLLNNKLISTTEDVDGFIVTSANSDLAREESSFRTAPLLKAAQDDVRNVIQNQDLSGNKYADSNAYIWNEDTNAYTEPVVCKMPAPTPVTVGTSLAVKVTLSGTGVYTYWEYIKPTTTADIFVCRKDGKELDPAAVTITAKLGGQTFAGRGTKATRDGVAGVVMTVALKDIWPATSWTADSYALTASATSSERALKAGSASQTVGAAALALVTSLTASATELTTGGTIAAAITDETGTVIGGDIAEFSGVTYDTSILEFEDSSTASKAQGTFRVK